MAKDKKSVGRPEGDPIPRVSMNIRVLPGVTVQLDKLAKEMRRSRAWIVGELVENFLRDIPEGDRAAAIERRID